MSTWASTLIFVCTIKITSSSVGDQSPFYARCVRDCNKDVCDKGDQLVLNENLLSLGVTFWSCKEDCKYKCRWNTVEAFMRKNYSVPQFNGKWPFIRMLGLEEPASVVFSLFNFFMHVKLINQFRQQVSAKSPYYYVWHLHALVQLNSWVWSTIFHTRDTVFTEKMDYISAFSVVLFSFYTMGLRYIRSVISLKTLLWSLFCCCIALNHFYYLSSENFDYGYNMQLNCAVGFLTVLGWILWTLTHYRTQPHAWWISLYSISMVVSMSLELFDFPPLLWTFDAHSLWHLSTAFIILFFYKFIILDCKYLCEEEQRILKSKLD